MKSLPPSRIEVIDALVAEGGHMGLTAAWLEKDEHLTDSLRAIFALRLDGLRLVLCGGTSLSKGFSIIDRMSEDVDLKVILSDEVAAQSQTKIRKRLSILKSEINGTLAGLGLQEDATKAIALNDNRYIHTQWTYSKQYTSAGGIRPTLQIELTARAPALPIEAQSITALTERFAPLAGLHPFEVLIVSPAETLAEKILSFLRRFAQHRDQKMNRAWDDALVRHIYDVHCLCRSRPELLTSARSVFANLVRQDTVEFGMQHPEFASNPSYVMSRALAQSSHDQQTQQEYKENLLPLIYGGYRPSFEEAFATFEATAKELLATLSS